MRVGYLCPHSEPERVKVQLTLHNIAAIKETDGDLCAEKQVHCLLLLAFSIFLPGNDYSINIKSTKRCTSISLETDLFQSTTLRLSMDCSRHTCLSAYIPPFMNGRWKL